MNILGNVIWLLFGGLAIAIEYFIAGVLLCLTIVGIPFGYQIFKLGIFTLLPFGQKSISVESGSGCLSLIMNLLWIVLGGIWISLTHLFFGVLLCVTIVGIPFGMQHFKLMAMAFTPFGRRIIPNNTI